MKNSTYFNLKGRGFRFKRTKRIKSKKTLADYYNSKPIIIKKPK